MKSKIEIITNLIIYVMIIFSCGVAAGYAWAFMALR